ncbi:MAG: alpha-amylase family glycosyl hydrolase [Flavobacteriaceae bacterium]|nr:alpha-amylase family glycosyl hydrolase [Flavobacteriaceae bacterium]
MKNFFLLFTFFSGLLAFAETGIYDAYIIVNGNYYDAHTSTSNPDFNHYNFGSFDQNSTFVLSGGQLKTWKNGSGDVTGAFMYYRIYKQGEIAENFLEINLPWKENNIDGYPNNQRWEKNDSNINLLNGLAPGNYFIEIYFKASTNEGDRWSSNNGQNFKASFTVNEPIFQIGNVSISPIHPSRNELLKITFDANGTALAGVDKVYLHSGVGTEGPDSRHFNYTQGNWGLDNGLGEMSALGNNIWEIELSSIDNYYNIPQNEDVFALNFLFRSADGSLTEDNAGRNYHFPINPGNYFILNSPVFSPYLIEIDTEFEVNASASSIVNWTLNEITSDGNIIQSIASSQANSFTILHNLNNVNLHYYQLIADFGTESKYKNFEVQAYNAPISQALPAGAKQGINPNFPNQGEFTFVLHTPTTTTYSYYDAGNCSGNSSVATTSAKNVIHIIGDFNNWEVREDFKMKKDGDFWWITLNPSTDFPSPLEGEYVYQYLIDGSIRIGDPYANKISDPDDQYINSSVYPDLIQYPYSKTTGRASVLGLINEEYQWQIPNFERIYERDRLNVYELHFRDFTEEGTYKAATEKLDYIAEMGINTIHVMPVSEFEGNNSWGYNPNYYFAADKAYGPANDLKEFIDEAHKRGIAVINDLVLNHAFYSNPNAMMYWDHENNRPANDNPWFNPIHKGVYDQAGHWGADWNHASEHTRNMMDDILRYWITEFKFDGFRFDFTKGFTQADPDPMDPWASSYDQCRIAILKRMVDEMWDIDNSPIEHYAVFEHLANDDEDKELANHGILMWSGAGPQHSWAEMAMGTTVQSFWSSVHSSRNFNFPNYMSYMESHDEERIGFKVLNWGVGNDNSTAYLSNRLKLVAGFNMFLPGPRMVWQFGELGYDISIDNNGRTGDKPSAWELGYDTDAERKEIYNYYKHIFNFRNKFNLYLNINYANIGSTTDWTRRMTMGDNNGNNIITIGNFDPNNTHTITPGFQTTGTWFKYNGDPTVDGTPFQVNSTNDTYTLYTEDPAYILSNVDIIPPVFNVENSTIQTDFCQFTLNESLDIQIGTWNAGTTDLQRVADNSGQVSLELLEINGNTATQSTLQGFVPVNGANQIIWRATDLSGNSSTFEQIINIERGDCHKPIAAGVGLNSDILISTLDRGNQFETTKQNGLLVLESKNKGLIITKISAGQTTDIITEPVEGMIVFDENEACLKLYNGQTWGCIQQKAVPVN